MSSCARRAIDASGTEIVLTARTEGFLWGRTDIGEATDRLRAFAEAGADCLYAPGIRSAEKITAVVEAVAPKPVNLLIYGPSATVAEAEALGGRRISVGGSFARAALGALMRAAIEVRDHGTFGYAETAMPGDSIARLMSQDHHLDRL